MRWGQLKASLVHPLSHSVRTQGSVSFFFQLSMVGRSTVRVSKFDLHFLGGELFRTSIRSVQGEICAIFGVRARASGYTVYRWKLQLFDGVQIALPLWV